MISLLLVGSGTAGLLWSAGSPWLLGGGVLASFYQPRPDSDRVPAHSIATSSAARRLLFRTSLAAPRRTPQIIADRDFAGFLWNRR